MENSTKEILTLSSIHTKCHLQMYVHLFKLYAISINCTQKIKESCHGQLACLQQLQLHASSLAKCNVSIVSTRTILHIQNNAVVYETICKYQLAMDSLHACNSYILRASMQAHYVPKCNVSIVSARTILHIQNKDYSTICKYQLAMDSLHACLQQLHFACKLTS